MFIVWIVLSVFIGFIIVETATSMWLNSDADRVSIKFKWSLPFKSFKSFKLIQGKFVKKNAS